MKQLLKYIKGDRSIWMIVIILSVFSLLAVYSSTGTLAYRFQAGNTEYYLVKHLIIILLGLGILFVAHRFKYTYYSRISQLALLVAIPLLLITLLSGTNINEANRWLTLPIINISFQSSDFAKLAIIIFMARGLAKNQGQIKDFKQAFLPLAVPLVVVCLLILPANFSSAAVLFTTCAVLMFIGRIQIKYILALSGVGLVITALFIVLVMNLPHSGRVDTWQRRVSSFVDKDAGGNYQSDQAKIAIATGGIIGKLPGNSTQRNFLPQAYSDFIYAIIIEEYGLIGGFGILMLYMMLFYRGIRVAHKSPGTFGALLAAGLSFSLVFQALINMAVAVGLLPVTGEQLPMVSMGGTSLWFTSLSIGIILSISRKIEEDEKEENQHAAAVART